MKMMTNAITEKLIEAKLDKYHKFLESVLNEQPYADFFSLKVSIVEHVKQKCPEFFEESQTGASIEVFDYMVELLATATLRVAQHREEIIVQSSCNSRTTHHE